MIALADWLRSPQETINCRCVMIPTESKQPANFAASVELDGRALNVKVAAALADATQRSFSDWLPVVQRVGVKNSGRLAEIASVVSLLGLSPWMALAYLTSKGVQL